MSLEKIISITGKPGLFKLLSQSKGGFIVEELQSGKKTSISAQHQVSVLENIAIYTHEEELPLGDVFQLIGEKNGFKADLHPKASEKELREKMESFLPNYDEDRVYASDIKKLFNWYNLLVENKILTPKKSKKKKEEE